MHGLCKFDRGGKQEGGIKLTLLLLLCLVSLLTVYWSTLIESVNTILASIPVSSQRVALNHTNPSVLGATTLSSIVDDNFNLSVSGSIRGSSLVSTAPQGVSPQTVGSTTPVANLNTDLLDGYDWDSDITFTGDTTFSGTTTFTSMNPGLTSGSLVFQGSAGLTQDNSNLFWNDTDNRLGIGTSTPDSTLHVSGTAKITGDVTLSSDLAVNGGDLTTSATTLNLFTGSATTINLGTSATSMSVGAGSGTTTINNNLSVGGTTRINSLTYTWPSSHTTSGFLQNDGAGTLSWTTIGASSVTPDSLDFTEFKDAMTLDASTDIAISGSNVLSLTNTGTGNSFLVNDVSADTTPFVIDASGNVGIGTTAPEQIFSISGLNPRMYMTNTMGNSWLFGSDNLNDFTFWENGFSSARLTMRSGGNVGIGDTSPDYKLEVTSLSGGDSTFALTDDDIAHGLTVLAETNVYALLKPISSTNGGLKLEAFSDSDAPGLTINGYIGTTNPTDTVPAITLIGAKTNDLGVSVKDMDAAETVLQIANNDNTAAITVLGNGKIGIGTTAPGNMLHVGSASVTDATALLRLEDANSTCDFTADAGAPTCGSDLSLKKNIHTVGSTLELITALRPVTYHWNTDDASSPLQTGFIAQEVAAVIPNLVTDGTWIDGSTKKFLSMGGMMPYVVGAIKELDEKVNREASSSAPTSITQQTSDLFTAMATTLEQLKSQVTNIFSEIAQLAARMLKIEERQQAGNAIILAGNDTVHIRFSRPFDVPPIITISAMKHQTPHFLDNVTIDGFDIKVSLVAPTDLQFTWSALRLDSVTTSVSDQPTPTIEEPTPAPTPFETPSAIITPTNKPTPEVEEPTNESDSTPTP